MVTKEEGENLAKAQGIPFFECSALNGLGTTEAFEELLGNILKHEKAKYAMNERDDGSIQEGDGGAKKENAKNVKLSKKDTQGENGIRTKKKGKCGC